MSATIEPEIKFPPVGGGPLAEEHTSFWLWVMCLTGVDYFSTLGYQPSIAFEATGRLAPFATILLVLVTLFCALPIYRAVAAESPHGQGSIAMLEKLVPGWWGKLFVLVLLGFAATDFVITKTLSAADAAKHLVHNPYWQQLPSVFQGQMQLTMASLVLLGAMFLRGFREVIGIAVTIVFVYLTLNAVVIGSGLVHLATHGHVLSEWWTAVRVGDWAIDDGFRLGGGPLGVLAVCVVLFPKLALGLSGFETGVAVMPLVRGDESESPDRPLGRIRNTRRLLLTAAVIMSLYLLLSSLVASTLIAPEELQTGGNADGRALAYLAHGEGATDINPWFGSAFGAVYDISTVAILWFAGASAMSGLLHIIPRYLPRYGMAPKWTAATRPLIVLLTFISFFVTWRFDANVAAQGGAYATGVMVLMLSAAVAVAIDRWNKAVEKGQPRIPWGNLVIIAVFLYTTIAIVIEKPEGVRIATVFIVAIVVASIVSRIVRSTELRFDHFTFADETSRVLWDTLGYLDFPMLVPHRPGRHAIEDKDKQIHKVHRISYETPVVFLEASLGDTSQFVQKPVIEVTGDEGRIVVRITQCASIAHAVASVALQLAKCGKPPELHFGWSDRSPMSMSVNFVLFGEGNVPWMVHELIRRAEPDPTRRPRVIVG